MGNQYPIRTARRKARRDEHERLGLAASPCVLCFEDHHTGGQNHDRKLAAPLCKMHHGAMHEQMLRRNISLQHEPNPTKRVAMAMRAMAVYRREEADAMDRMANLLDPPED